MNITPLDVRKQSFGKSFRGYDAEEVEAFLEMVAETFERLNETMASLQSKNRELQSTVERYQQLEQTLQDTLVTAQKIADEARENARKEAGLIVKEAEISADRVLESARQGSSELRREILTLRTQRDTFVTRLGALCKGQLDLLELFSEEPEEERIRPSTAHAPARSYPEGEDATTGHPAKVSPEAEE